MIKACIFDLDGVIVDTAKYHYLAWKRLAKEELEFDFKESDNERLKGVSRMASLDILLELGGLDYDIEHKLKLAGKKNEWYIDYIEKMTPDEILPGVRRFLEELKQNKMKIAIGSASKNTGTILKYIDMENYYDAVVDGTKVSKAKPDPEVFLKAADELNVEPEYCVVFEDAAAGIQAAINGNMYSIGVGSPRILAKADMVIPGFEQMSMENLRDL